MNKIEHIRMRNTLAVGFLAIIALGTCGYANMVRVQQATSMRNRRISALVHESISHAQDLALYATQMSAYTGEYVHTGDASYREFKWETDDKNSSALTALTTTIAKLPQNGEVLRKFRAVYELDENVLDPREDDAISLATHGETEKAKVNYNVFVVPANYLMEDHINDLVMELNRYQAQSERAADFDSAHAVRMGWLAQAVILAISLLIGLGISIFAAKDVRNLVEVQRRLAESESRLRTALTGAPLILFSIDTNGVFTLIEGQVLHTMGIDPKSLVGKSMQDMFPERGDAIANIDRALAGESFTTTVVFEHCTFSTSYSPLLDENGRVTGIIGVSTDVTDRAAAEHEAERLLCELEESNQELAHAYDSTIQGWSAALDLRDRETDGHSRRVTEVTALMARAMGLSDAEIVHIRRGALLHDIGKMGIPDAILLKPGPLTDDEWVIMRKHPEYAYSLLSGIDFLRPALDIPLYHHEKWDGTGYPHRLQGADIPLAARIFAIVDVWDALSSDRPYRAAWPSSKVMEHLRSLAGTHFDPAVVDVFEKVMAEHAVVRRFSYDDDLATAA